MLLIGVGLTIASAFYVSSLLAIIGVSIIFWGIILLYITPSKLVSLTLFNASHEATAANIERLILELNLSESGIYLPPRNLKNNESSLVFIPKTPQTPLPTSDEPNQKQLTNQKTGALVTPPGTALLRIFEEAQGDSFTKTELTQIQNILPRILTESMELAENVEIQIRDNTVEVEITGSVLNEICLQTDSQPKAHKQIGCLLSSAIACALAKSTGKPTIIQNEIRNQEAKTTHITYQILEV
jgi:hypothetical protein